MIKALIFDFDGLILETEGPIYQSWQELYEAQGGELSFSIWSRMIGLALNEFDPYEDLERQLGKPVDRLGLAPGRAQRELELIFGPEGPAGGGSLPGRRPTERPEAGGGFELEP